MWLHQSSLWELPRCVLLRENVTRLGEFSYQEGFSSLFTLTRKLPGTWGSSALALGRKQLAAGVLIPVGSPQLHFTVSSFKSRTVGVMESHTLQENKIVRLCNAHRCLPFHLLSRRLNTCWLIVQLQEMSLVSQLEHLFDCVICMKPCHSSQQMFIFLPWKSGSSNMWGVLFPCSVCCMWTTDLIHSSQGKPSTSLLWWCTSLNETELGE